MRILPPATGARETIRCEAVMAFALLIDFGSTYTKLRAVDLHRHCIVASGQGPSTVNTDIMVGMRAALADLERRWGGLLRFQYRLASSSAAGGLRMVTVGLVPELTAQAAREAALGAGAKLIATFAYRLTARDLAEIDRLAPDILLLAGGTDGGNSEVILHNAAMLAKSSIACPIVYAGNRAASDDACVSLGGKAVVCTENVMPEFNELNIEPARGVLRRIFIDRIVHAKGIDRAAAEFDQVLMPTPAAVLEGSRLVADGLPGTPGLGSVLVVDPGGATTDVHSISSDEPAPGVIHQGLPEPREKRTVEGDLGMRHNATTIVESCGLDRIAEDAGVDVMSARCMLDRIVQQTEYLPNSAGERAFDHALVRAAVRVAVARHCGTIEAVYTATGKVTVKHGKDLSNVAAVIGTGGALVHSADPRSVLEMALADDSAPLSLRPKHARLFLDREYALYACGLLGGVEPQAALELALDCLEPVERR
jgi:uncharacterized protein (TIGR01319 family)